MNKIVKIIIFVVIVFALAIAGFFLYPDKTTDAPTGGDNPIGEDIDTSDWQTYRNEEYGFEFKYPGEWEVKDNTPEIEDNDSLPGYARVDYMPLNLSFKNSNSDHFYFKILNTIEDNQLEASGGWESCEKIGIENISSQEAHVFAIDQGVPEMKVIKYQGKSFVFLHYGEARLNDIISTFKFIK